MTDQATKSIGGTPATSACSEQQKEDPATNYVPCSYESIEQSILFFFPWNEAMTEFFEKKFGLPHADQPLVDQNVCLELQWDIPLTCNAQSTDGSIACKGCSTHD